MQELAQEFNKLGEEFYLKGDYQTALKHFENALNFDDTNIHSLNNIGVVLSKLGEYKRAEEFFRSAVSRDPTYAEGFNNLGNVMRLMGFHINAEIYLDIALNIRPDYEGALLNLGLVTEDIGNLKKSLECNEKAYQIYRRPEYLAHMYYLKRKMCDWRGLKDIEKKLDKFSKLKGETPFINLIRTADEKSNLKVAKIWSENYQDKYIKTEVQKNLKIENYKLKIKIGYISETFRDHPVGHCVYKMFKYHKKTSFEIFTYSYGVDDASIFRKEVEKHSRFFDIRKLDTKSAVELIKSHKLDILIDLQGLTKDNRSEILREHPAKLQISYLGFPGTSGDNLYDYLITDRIAVPENSRKYFTEKIAYLDRAYQVNSKLPISKIKYVRKDFSLPEDKIVFCSFNRSVKIQEDLFDSWLEILKDVPDSVLWLFLDNGYMQKNLLSYAVSKKVDATRIIFSDRVTIDRHLSRLKLADIALDTSIYSGGATTANALYVGIPVVTLRGRHYLSRMSASQLTAIGLETTIAKNLSDYKKIAIKLAKDKKYYQKIKNKIIKNRDTIFDAKSFVHDFEKLLLILCKNHLN